MVRSLPSAPLLALLGIIATAAASCSKPQSVTLDMQDYKFIPDRLVFQRNVRYRLHLENHGKETHEVTAPTFFASVEIDNPDALNPDRTEIVMQPGDSKDVYLTARKPGTYDLRCSDHDWAGMTGGIMVQ